MWKANLAIYFFLYNPHIPTTGSKGFPVFARDNRCFAHSRFCCYIIYRLVHQEKHV